MLVRHALQVGREHEGESIVKLIPQTKIEHYGFIEGVAWKISRRDETAAIRAGLVIEKRGTSYIYVRKARRSIFMGQQV